MKMLRITTILLFCLFIQVMRAQPAVSVPDSLMSEDGVYYYMFTAPEKSKYIMSYLRKEGQDKEGNKLSALDLDYLEGDMYYNTGQPITAIHFYERALAVAEKQQNPAEMFDLMHRLISSFDQKGDINGKVEMARKMRHKAEECHNKVMVSVAMFELGSTLCTQGKRDTGLKMMLEANMVMEANDYKHKYDNLRYQYETLVLEFRKAQDNKQALAMCEKLKGVIGKYDKGVKPMEYETEGHELLYQSLVAPVYSRMGRSQDAENAYKRFNELKALTGNKSRAMFTYLYESGRYGDLLKQARELEAKSKERNDTINQGYASLVKYMAMAQIKTGDYRNAALNYQRLLALRDSLNLREFQSQALQYATLYDVEKSEAQAKYYSERSRIYGVVAAFAILGLVVLLISMYRVVKMNRAMKQKNVILARTIGELSKAQSETSLAMSQSMKAVSHDVPATDATTEESAPAEVPEEDVDVNIEGAGDDEDDEPMGVEPAEANDDDHHRFMSIEHEIISRRLYASNLNREQLIKELGIPRAQFAALFRAYAGESYPKYMNRLRLREAVRILQESPQYTIDAVAAECGMSRQLFYLLFKEKYGITPTEFRAMHKN